MCISKAPGTFHLTNPTNYSNSSVTTPITLEWEFPSVGESCLGTVNTTVLFSVALSQTYPPQFFEAISENQMYLQLLAPGMWFWTVFASNRYYTTPANETHAFLVPTKYYIFC